MSPKVIVIPIVAVGVAAAAMFKLVSLRRTPSPAVSQAVRPRVSAPREAVRPHVSAPHEPQAPLANAAGVLSKGPNSTTVLPISFWDAASEQLEVEEVLETPRMTASRDTYDSLAPEDLGAEWLSRATEAFDMRGGAEDDPAEVQADSLSMISEASRLAAASPDSERFDQLGADSSLFDEDGRPRSG